MDINSGQIKFSNFKLEHVKQVAKLHIDGLPEAFITSLGLDFVIYMYEAIAKSDVSFGFVAEGNGEVLGFVIFSSDLIRLYRQVFLRNGIHLIFPLARKLLSLRQTKNMLETMVYPWKIKKLNFPSTGLISITIAEKARGKGLGTTLIQKGFDECSRRGIEQVRVLVGSANRPAQQLYLKCGFQKALDIKRHNGMSTLYLADISKKRISANVKINSFAQFLKATGVNVLTEDNVDWYEYEGFMVPAYLPHQCLEITTAAALKILKKSHLSFVRWHSGFGNIPESQWWYVLKRGHWHIEDIRDKKKRWMIRRGKNNFSVRVMTFDEVINLCPTVAQTAASRYKGDKETETRKILEQRINAAKQVPGILEYIGCFAGNKLVSFSENYICDNAVWMVNIRHDPAFLNKYSSYGLVEGILNHYLNDKKVDYVLDGSRSIHHKTEFQEYLIRVFDFSKEYAILNVEYARSFRALVKLAYPFKDIFWYLCGKFTFSFLDNAAAILKQEYIRRQCKYS